MNKVILIGRLTKDPEVRYSQSANPVAVTRFTLAVNRRFKREGEQEADFIQCVAFGKTGEFAGKYFTKGKQAVVTGRLQVSSWDDQNGQRRWSTDVVVEEMEFGESKSASEANRNSFPNQEEPPKAGPASDDFYQIDESIDDDDLPF